MSRPTLYTYWRSTAAWRVRIALAWKGVDYEAVPVHLLADGGRQHGEAYRALNPEGRVPLYVEDGLSISQSLAIVEYLEERYPEPPLLPADPAGRARVRSLALLVACDIHPLNNLSVLQYLTGTLGLGENAKTAWYRHWVANGFRALEARLAGEEETGTYCHGDAPGVADLCLVPQVYNARRFDCDMTPYPRIRGIHDACMELEPFRRAVPDAQPDAE